MINWKRSKVCLLSSAPSSFEDELFFYWLLIVVKVKNFLFLKKLKKKKEENVSTERVRKGKSKRTPKNIQEKHFDQKKTGHAGISNKTAAFIFLFYFYFFLNYCFKVLIFRFGFILYYISLIFQNSFCKTVPVLFNAFFFFLLFFLVFFAFVYPYLYVSFYIIF